MDVTEYEFHSEEIDKCVMLNMSGTKEHVL